MPIWQYFRGGMNLAHSIIGAYSVQRKKSYAKRFQKSLRH